MEVYTNAIIISYLKYGESSAVVRFFTEKKGFATLMWKGVFNPKNKSRSLLAPLNEVQIYYRDKDNETLNFLKKIETDVTQNLSEVSVEKNMLLLFLSEVLQNMLQNEPEHPKLYQFIQFKLKDFKTVRKTQNWTQEFLLEICDYLGFKPYNNFQENSFFDLVSGNFNIASFAHSLNEKDSRLWARFLNNETSEMNAFERIKILQILMQYFSFQIPNFKKPKSLNIIKDIFTS